MKSFSRFVFVAVALSITACSIKPVTQEGLRTAPALQATFTIDMPYQKVFDNLLETTRACFSRVATQDQLFVSGKKVIANKTANIQVVLVYLKKEQDVHFMIDLKSIDGKKTTVTTYTSDSDEAEKVNAVKSWANEKNSACEA